MKISMIACVGKNLELGNNNDLIFHIPNDLKYFKKLTEGHIVVMGKNTFKSLPGILKNRKNIVLTRSNELNNIKEIEVFHSLEEFFNTYQTFEEEIFIIGGSYVYKEFLPYATTLYLTEVDKSSLATVYFPKFNLNDYQKEIIKKEQYEDINYQFTIYRRL